MPATREELILLARRVAMHYCALCGLVPCETPEHVRLDGDLICAIVEQESSWQPGAIRYEPAFLARYVAPLYTAGTLNATEAYARCFSWGLMQVMGQVAREDGFQGQSLAELCDPATGLDAGCKHFAKIAQRVGPVQDAASVVLLHWNGGSNPNYPGQVLARVPGYTA